MLCAIEQQAVPQPFQATAIYSAHYCLHARIWLPVIPGVITAATMAPPNPPCTQPASHTATYDVTHPATLLATTCPHTACIRGLQRRSKSHQKRSTTRAKRLLVVHDHAHVIVHEAHEGRGVSHLLLLAKALGGEHHLNLAAGHDDGLVGGLAGDQGVDQVLLLVTDLVAGLLGAHDEGGGALGGVLVSDVKGEVLLPLGVQAQAHGGLLLLAIDLQHNLGLLLVHIVGLQIQLLDVARSHLNEQLLAGHF
mmetsp:Transcript_9754/g.24286  ORF Transcript_9754/g.24286 Transcript_9754/m.24286 type:complete len:251 (+) Transcript_9754:107-859(+)